MAKMMSNFTKELNDLNDLKSQIFQNIKISALRENLKLGHLDNFKDRLAEVDKTLTTMTRYVNMLEGEIKDVSCQVESIMWIYGSKLHQIINGMNDCRSMIYDLSNRLKAVEDSQHELNKNVKETRSR
jgi:archaellum component FlaC